MTWPMFLIFVVKSAVSHTEPWRKVQGQNKTDYAPNRRKIGTVDTGIHNSHVREIKNSFKVRKKLTFESKKKEIKRNF